MFVSLFVGVPTNIRAEERADFSNTPCLFVSLFVSLFVCLFVCLL
jgi:hypothetical protein